MLDQGARVRIENARVCGSTVEVEWGDGHESRFHATWLRHQCECAFCGTSLNGVRGLRISDIAEEIGPAALIDDASGIEIVWSHGAHRSRYGAEWLRNHCYSKVEREARRHVPITWDATFATSIPHADFNVAEVDSEQRLKMLMEVADFGICRIVNAPMTAEDGQRLVSLVGPQRTTNHGSFTLSAKEAVDNVGDTTGALAPHVDEPYRLSAIGITIFQVIQPAFDGGHTTLVDGFEVARRLRSQAPAAFRLLAETPITCHRVEGMQNAGRIERRYASRLPVIRLDAEGEVVGVRVNERQIAPLDIDADLVEPYYRALRQMLELAYDPQLMITIALGAGEGLLFNNQRILHGRTEYVADQDPPRSVVTRSVDLDDFYSAIRTLSASVGQRGPKMAYGQGMAG